MGTNVYAYIKSIDDSVYDRYAELAKKHDIEGIKRLNEEVADFERENIVHIGKRSGGWKFLFNHNSWKYYGYTKESINSFLKSCYKIENEYGEELTVDEFWKEYVDDFKNGFNGEQYELKEIESAKENEKLPFEKRSQFILSYYAAKQSYETAKHYNFYEEKYYKNELIPYDNLDYRFSNSIDFC